MKSLCLKLFCHPKQLPINFVIWKVSFSPSLFSLFIAFFNLQS